MGYGIGLASSTKYEQLGLGTGAGTTVTSAAGAYGSLTTLGTTSFDYDGFFLNAQPNSAVRYRVTITVNNGGSDVAVVTDAYYNASASTTTATVSTFFPIAIPSGGIIKAKAWSGDGATSAIRLSISGTSGDSRSIRGSASKHIACTDFTSFAPTNTITMTGTTATAWSTIQASTAKRITALYVSTYDAGAGGLTGGKFSFDIGWGAAASERVLFTILANSVANGLGPSMLGPFPCDFPSGTRLAARGQANAANTNVLGIVLGGLSA